MAQEFGPGEVLPQSGISHADMPHEVTVIKGRFPTCRH
jgi:hypothetical protein